MNPTGNNRVDVLVDGGFLEFMLNDDFLWGGFVPNGPTFGSVGISAYTSPGKTSDILVDSASLRTFPIGQKHRLGATGVVHKGGSIDMAPR